MENALGELFGDIASAIREKTGDTEKMKPAQFPEKISEIETGADVSGVTATAADVLEGKTIVDAQGNPVYGTMVNRGSVSGMLHTYQTGYNIQKGYHDGYGYVNVLNSGRKTVIPSKNEQYIRGEAYKPNGINIYGYGFLTDVTVRAIPDKYQDVTPVTATAEDVRAGKVFVDAQGNAVEGALSGTIADVSGVTATAADVRQGKIIVDAQGNEVVGTLEVQQKAPDVIWVGKDSVSNALVGTGVIRYVTFCNHDGTVTYGQKSVIAGENCVDPVTAGHMETPTRESTAQYNYTFSGGWATEPGGGKDSNALKNVTEDRTVYANFIAAVRYYTITYLDSDGTTVLKTESLAYGAMPSYSPVKEGYAFTGWTTGIIAVTGDASYVATWEEKVTFASASWAKIAEISEAGDAEKYFAVGDARNVPYTNADGTSGMLVAKVAGFARDTIASSGGLKAGMTIDFCVIPDATTAWATSGSNLCTPTNENHIVDDFLDGVFTRLPSDFQEVVKDISKNVQGGSSWTTIKTYKLFPYIAQELGITFTNGLPGTKYPLFETENIIPTTMNTGEYVDYWLRDGKVSSNRYYAGYVFNNEGNPTVYTVGKDDMPTVQNHVRFACCI